MQEISDPDGVSREGDINFSNPNIQGILSGAKTQEQLIASIKARAYSTSTQSEARELFESVRISEGEITESFGATAYIDVKIITSRILNAYCHQE